MTMHGTAKYGRAVLWFMAILLAFLVVVDFLIISYQRKLLLDETYMHTRNELELIGTLSREALLKQDYITIRNFLSQFGAEQQEIVSLSAIGLKNFVLAEYRRTAPARHSFHIEHKVEYEGNTLATLRMAKDLAPIDKTLRTLYMQLIAVSIVLTGILGMALWHALRKKAMMPLEKEITERRQAEEALREAKEHLEVLYDASPDMIFLYAEDGRLVDVNRNATKAYGFSREEMLKLNPEDTIGAEKIQKAFDREKLDFEWTAKRKDGAEFPVEVRLRKLEMTAKGGNREVAVLAVVRDITERKKMHEELLKAHKLESLGILAGGIAHDFNNLLTVILGNISLAKMFLNSEDKVSERLAIAENASLKARHLTNHLLTFSKGGEPLKKTASVTELIKEAANFALSGSNIKCRISIPDDLIPVEIDEGQMIRVFHNLIINARDAMPNGGTVEIMAENVTVGPTDNLPLINGEHIRISVKDHGIGIPQENLQRIFDPYFTTKEMGNIKGTGLGLSVCYSIIKKHGGLIAAESEVGVGTTFYIYLAASRKGAKTDEIVEKRAFTGKGSVLVMDDEELVREVVGEMLYHMGYEVKFASDTAEAVDLYQEAMGSGKPFDAVIMDLTIRGGNGGREAVKILLEIDPGVKAIISSGYSDNPVVTDYKEHGFMDVVTKPYKMEELGEKLHRIITMP